MSIGLRSRVSIVLMAVIFTSAAGSAVDYYKLQNVRRVDQDLYRSGDVYIQTKYCYHYTYGENAVLKWDGAYGENKIIWDDDSTCQVKDYFKK